MRIKITFRALEREPALPLDNHPYASLIYGLVGIADLDAAGFLHDEGVQAREEERKRFKPFVFSRLQQVGKRIAEGRQWLAPGPVEWQIGSPIEELMQMLYLGLSANPVVYIGDRQGGARLEATAVTVLSPPRVQSPMQFKTLSPLFASVTEAGPDGKRTKHHLRADDPRYADAIANNLRQKFMALTGEPAPDAPFVFRFPRPPKSQLVQYAGTNHKSCDGVFEVAGDPRLIHLGWECGFGEANSKGFGMAWAVRA